MQALNRFNCSFCQRQGKLTISVMFSQKNNLRGAQISKIRIFKI